MLTLTAELKGFIKSHDTDAIRQRFGIDKGGIVQQTVDKSVIDWNMQYCPMETGVLSKSPYSVTEIGSGEVAYPGPYARYLYYGEVMGPNIPVFEDDSGEPTRFFSPPGQKKHLTGRPLKYNTDLNPLAGAFWFERMKADHLDDILKEAKSVAGIK